MSKDGLGFGEVEAKLQNPGWCGDYRAPQDCLDFVRGHFRLQSMAVSNAAWSHPHPHFPRASIWAAPLRCGSEFQSALTNELTLSVLAWGLSLQCRAAENRGCFKSKNYLVTKRAITALVTRTVPFLQCCSERTAEGRGTHSDHCWAGIQPLHWWSVCQSAAGMRLI